jgi:hypothetical protein
LHNMCRARTQLTAPLIFIIPTADRDCKGEIGTILALLKPPCNQSGASTAV